MLGSVMGLWKQQWGAGPTSLPEQHRCLAEPLLPPAGLSPPGSGISREGCWDWAAMGSVFPTV